MMEHDNINVYYYFNDIYSVKIYISIPFKIYEKKI